MAQKGWYTVQQASQQDIYNAGGAKNRQDTKASLGRCDFPGTGSTKGKPHRCGFPLYPCSRWLSEFFYLAVFKVERLGHNMRIDFGIHASSIRSQLGYTRFDTDFTVTLSL